MIVALVGLLSIPFTLALWSVCAVQIWAWHITPFFNLPLLSFWSAIGLACMVAMFRATNPNLVEKDRDDATKLINSLVNAVLKPILLLGIAWIAK